MNTAEQNALLEIAKRLVSVLIDHYECDGNDLPEGHWLLQDEAAIAAIAGRKA